MAQLPMMPDVQASCAICGAPAYPQECPHEGQRLELALNQAYERWTAHHQKAMKEWVLVHARNTIIHTFTQLRETRMMQRQDHLQRLPYYSLYCQFQGSPPLAPHEVHTLQVQFAQADATLRKAIDEDWRQSCMKYPEVLDYFFNLVEVEFPAVDDERVQRPVFGGKERYSHHHPHQQQPAPHVAREPRRVRGGEHEHREGKREHRKHGKRRDSRGLSPPDIPRAPSPEAYY